MANVFSAYSYSQLQTGTAVAGAEHYNGMFDCFRKIIKHEGCVQEVPALD